MDEIKKDIPQMARVVSENLDALHINAKTKTRLLRNAKKFDNHERIEQLWELQELIEFTKNPGLFYSSRKHPNWFN